MVESRTSTGFALTQGANPGLRLEPYNEFRTPMRATDMPSYITGGFVSRMQQPVNTWNTGIITRRPDQTWYQNQGQIVYNETPSWLHPQQQPNQLNNNGFGTDDVMQPSLDQNMPTTEDGPSNQPIGGIFSCNLLEGAGSAATEASVKSLGPADKYLEQMTFKIFNKSVLQGQVLYGIVYLNVKDNIVLRKIDIKLAGLLNKVVGGARKNKYDSPGKTITVAAVSSTGNRRNPNTYRKATEDFSGTDLMERLSLSPNPPANDANLLPFAGPIPLSPGTHAIPFAIRIPTDWAPTMKFHRKHNTESANVEHTTTALADISFDARTSGGQINLPSGKLPLEVKSCGALPAIVDGKYTAGDAYLIDLPSKRNAAQALIVLEKKNHLLSDTVRIYIWVTNHKAVSSISCKLIQTTNLSDFKLSDADYEKKSRRDPALEILRHDRNNHVHRRFDRRFVSTVTKQFPIKEGTIPVSKARPIDDKVMLPEAKREAGLKMELDIPKGQDPTLSTTDIRINYRVLIDFKVKGAKEPVIQDILLNLSEKLE